MLIKQRMRDSLVAILQATIPDVELVIGVWTDRATWLARSATATAQQLAAAQQTIAAFDVSDGAQSDRDKLKYRELAKAFLSSDRSQQGKALRAIADAAKDSDNALRAWITSFKAAVAAATSLNDLKTRVAALSSMPQLTTADVLAAIAARIDDGTVD